MGEVPVNYRIVQRRKSATANSMLPSRQQLALSWVLVKAHIVQDALENDLFACDAKWMLFVAAAYSARYDQKLCPFPPRYVSKNGIQNINELVWVINQTPPLKVLLRQLRNRNYNNIRTEVIRLLYWVFVEFREPCLRSLSREAFYRMLTFLPPGTQMLEQPKYILEVKNQSCILSNIASLGIQRSQDGVNEGAVRSIEYCFYGTRLDEFFKLLHVGFTPLAQQNQPAVLMKSLTAAFANSPFGAGWGASLSGPIVSCVALCSCIDAPPQLLERRSSPQGDEILAHCSELVQIRYLFLYTKKFAVDWPINEALQPPKPQCVDGVLVTFGLYLVALATITVGKHGIKDYIRHLLMHNGNLLIKFCGCIFADI